MKFFMTYRGAPATPEQSAQIEKFTTHMAKAGKLLMTGGMVRVGAGTKVAYQGKEFSVTDGPFAETKELIDGFALVEVGSHEEAVELARQFMSIAGEGTGEILQLFDADLPRS